MESTKYAGNLAEKNIAKHTGLRSGTEVKFHGLVWVVVLGLGVRYNYRGCGRETERQRLLTA